MLPVDGILGICDIIGK